MTGDVNCKYLTVEAAIKTYSIGRTKLYELIDVGSVRSIKLGRRRLIDAASVETFLDSLVEVA